MKFNTLLKKLNQHYGEERTYDGVTAIQLPKWVQSIVKEAYEEGVKEANREEVKTLKALYHV